MPLGSIPWNRRLGIANSKTPNASDFGSNVLNLPANFPIYQQQLLHSTEWLDGPSASSEWCGDQDTTSYQQECTLREISAHDTQFARRNLSNTAGMDFLTHRSTTTNQLYYVNNEPESGSYLSIDPSCSGQSFEPRDREIDQYLSGIFTDQNAQFWDLAPGGLWTKFAETSTSLERIHSNAMAYVYLRLRSETEAVGRGHIVLPPSSADALLGETDPAYKNSDYWQNFYNKIHLDGINIGNYHEDAITPEQLKALHLHHYSNSPLDNRFPSMTPLESVAMSASYIRKGVNWYKNHYSAEAPLPVDILLTEMGPAYQYHKNPRHWAGGWKGFQTGLEWWNTWLCWLTRRAPFECVLRGWDSGEHTLHACIHHPSAMPYIGEPDLFTQRNQWYFNSDSWSTDVFYDMPAKEIPQLEREIKFRAYEKSFSALETISWEGRNWLRTPFGACYAVWAEVGADPESTDLDKGWVLTYDQGTVLNAKVKLPAGWSTVYFPVIKSMGSFNPSTQFSIQWIHPNGRIYSHGFISMGEFSDSNQHYYHELDQVVYAAMVIPVVCYASTERKVAVRLTRNLAGVGAWLGRPVVLPKACSWFIQQ